MKLFYSPGACSLSPSISLREAGIPFDLERVDLTAKRTASGLDFLTINPKGYVPALQIDDGQVLTEGVAIIQWIADQRPEKKLAPAPGTMDRLRLQEWLNFIATELHKAQSPLYNAKATDELKTAIRERIGKRIAFLAKHLESRPYLMGEFTVADPYAFYTLRSWKKNASTDLSDVPSLKAYYDRLAARPTVRAALEADGLKP